MTCVDRYRLVFITAVLGTIVAGVSENDPDWKDPDEGLFSFDESPTHHSDSDKNVSQPAGDFHFRRLISHVVAKFDEAGISSGKFHVHVSAHSLKILRQYQSREANNGHSAYDVMAQLFNVRVRRNSTEEDDWHVMDEMPFVGIASRPWYQDSVFLILGGTALVFLVQVALRLFLYVETNFLRTVKWCILAMFIVSVPWEWYRLYAEARSAHTAEMLKGIPDECKPGKDVSLWANAASVMRATFIASEDPCLKYQKAILVDPLSDVTPVHAIAITCTRLFTEPLVYFFGALGKCTKALLVELPVVAHMFVAVILPVFVLLIVVLLILVVMRYNFRIFPFVSIGPSQDTRPAIESKETLEKLKALTEEIRQMREAQASLMPPMENQSQATRSKSLPAIQDARRQQHVEEIDTSSSMQAIASPLQQTSANEPDCEVRSRQRPVESESPACSGGSRGPSGCDSPVKPIPIKDGGSSSE